MKQGLLGDCWFLCACAALQKSRHLLDQVSVTVQVSLLLLSSCLLSTGRKREARQLNLLFCGALLRLPSMVSGGRARLSGDRGSEAQTQCPPHPQGSRGLLSALPSPEP